MVEGHSKLFLGLKIKSLIAHKYTYKAQTFASVAFKYKSYALKSDLNM